MAASCGNAQAKNQAKPGAPRMAMPTPNASARRNVQSRRRPVATSTATSAIATAR